MTLIKLDTLNFENLITYSPDLATGVRNLFMKFIVNYKSLESPH